MQPIVGLIGPALQSVGIIAPYPQKCSVVCHTCYTFLEALFGYWVVKLSSIDTPHKKSIVEVGYSMSGLLEGIRVPNILGFPAISKQQIFHSKSESCGEYGKTDIVVLKSSSSEG